LPSNQIVVSRPRLVATSVFSAAYLFARNCQKLSGLLQRLPGHISGKLRLLEHGSEQSAVKQE
jgi:hypothetical protein